ncbi:unnamed protein product [Symbiodinium necroappetens]|uniref:N-acetyltransferase domain-containing protein n=1 Tax=Symbiodinium necroappetens TaxID=1628268 RepID=A0A812L996_9DINO|nr:unnamed protein product [Symbiodinium necroappetens]
MGPGPEQVRRIDLEDVEVFMSLQDGFVLEHHSMTSMVYEEVSLLDWQHSLVCPREILEKPGGRRQQVVSIVKQEHRYYRDLYILLAREDGHEAGYVMYQVHKGKRKDAVASAYVEVKQIFVEPELRKRGLGKLLLDGMMQAVKGQQCHNIRLSVIDLNEAATRWYRVQGFVMIGLVWEYVGPADNSHLVAYQVMQKYSAAPEQPVADRATFFRSEIIGEVVTITYPDGSGPFDVTIRGWIELVLAAYFRRIIRIGGAEQGMSEANQQAAAQVMFGSIEAGLPTAAGGPALVEDRERQDEGSTQHRASVQSGTQSTEATASMDDHDHDGVDGRDPKDSDVSSASGKKETAKTGKDYVPEYNGSTPRRKHERRVKLFEASTGIDESCRAQELMERLSGVAWLAMESLDLLDLKHPKSVERLLAHLWQELEPLEYLRIFCTLADFYKNFRRTPGQEYIAYDMEFRNHLKRLEEIGAKIEGLTKAYWFIEKAGLSGDLRKQVVAVHATPDDSLDGPDKDEMEDAGAEAEHLEGELEVLLTQAAKKRAQIEKARGFNKIENPEDREKRIKSMKERMSCSACKAHGKTVYGHWHGDAACPYHRDHRTSDKNVLAVIEEQLSHSESDQDELFGPTGVYIATVEGDDQGLEMIPVWQEPNPPVVRRPRDMDVELPRLNQCKAVFPVRVCRLRFPQVAE